MREDAFVSAVYKRQRDLQTGDCIKEQVSFIAGLKYQGGEVNPIKKHWKVVRASYQARL